MGCDIFAIDEWNCEWCCNDWIFWENSKLKRITIVCKTNSYAHLKFNKEVNRITNIKF